MGAIGSPLASRKGCIVSFPLIRMVLFIVFYLFVFYVIFLEIILIPVKIYYKKLKKIMYLEFNKHCTIL